MPGDHRINACIDHFALMGYDASDICAVAAHLLKVYGGGPDAWKFLEEGCYQVVQDRLLEIEDEEKLKQDQDQQLLPLPECHQQQDGQQVEDEPPQQVVQDSNLEIEEEKLKQDQQLQPERHQQQDGQQVEDELEPPQVPDRVLQKRVVHVSTHVPSVPALTTLGGDASSSTTQPPSSDNIEHNIAQATTPHDVAEGTGVQRGPRRGTRVRRPSIWVKGSEWARVEET